MSDRRDRMTTFEITLIVTTVGAVLILAALIGASFGAQLGHLFG